VARGDKLSQPSPRAIYGNLNSPSSPHLLNGASQSGGICVRFDNAALRMAPYALSVLRIATALLFLEHGTSRLFGFPSPLPTPPLFTMYWFAGAIELVGGALLVFGLFTRAVALLASGEMAFAYFLSHAPRGLFPILNRGDGAILFCFIFFYLVFAGAGPLSLDALLRGKSRT
jgi:putative oxidoreductase